jgi:hypothetical protein
MLKMTTNKFFIVLFLFSLITISYAQETTEQRRAREHQAVIDYINFKHSLSPVNTNPADLTNEKYSLANKLSKRLGKSNAFEDRKRYLMNGNNITVEIWNYGGIGPGYPGRELRDILGMVWRDAPYIFQFTPLIAASVPSALDPETRIHIVSDGLFDYPGFRETDPQNDEFFWTWEPLPGYADPDQEFMASNPALDSDRDGKPDSWPRDWYSPALGEYVWPGYLTVGENNADLEVYWAMDDRYNLEFPYYPFLNDTTRKGLGVQIDGRAFQWTNSLAANALFVVFTITNVSDRDLDTVLFGIYGDPDLGGGSPYNQEDNGLFIPPYDYDGNHPVDHIPVYARSMVYFWDRTGKGKNDIPLGYLGCKFLESPGNPDDGIDNDGDGMIDEAQDDGIDNDGDWNPETDDVGVDGIPNTGDEGEGDGIPTAGRILPDGRPDPLAPGEPNFEYTDLDESDQIGLTSFNSWTWSSANAIKNDALVWSRNAPGNFSDIESNADIVFTFGSGYISLKKGEIKRISMAFIFGEDLGDLLVTAETVQDIYNKNYQFFKPPDKPAVYAVPDDKKVTLYWDTKAEESIDPITGNDFEGYVIYRSTRPDFADILKVTDGRGASYLYEPLKDLSGFEAKWDLQNEWRGYHPVSYQGRGLHYYLGDNTGLVHSFVDSNNVINGQTYYYAVVAYDHGDSLGIPPSETSKKITVDPITGQEIYDINTVKVIPGPRAAGYNSPNISATDVQKLSGYGNGIVDFRIINDLEVMDEKYTLTFSNTLQTGDTTLNQKNYSVIGEKTNTESFYLYDTKFASLSREFILDDENLVVKDRNGTVYQKDVDYIINFERGRIARTSGSSMPNNSEFIITYKSYAVYQSLALKQEDSNPVFEGVKLTVLNYDTLAFDANKSHWNNLDIPVNVGLASIGVASRKKFYPGDYIITFSDQNISTAKKSVSGTIIDIPVKYKVEEVSTGISIPIITLLHEKARNDSAWTRGDEIILFQPGAEGLGTDTLTWAITFTRATETDSVIPGDGDVFFFYSQRPFTNEDIYTLQTKPGFVDNELASSRLDNIYVVPNPYIGASSLEPSNRLPGQNRGERRIYFENLPMKCTIRIYTLSGELVNTLEHDSWMDNGREYWNLLNKDGFSISYGVYLAHIDAPGIGQKLIKFAIIK